MVMNRICRSASCGTAKRADEAGSNASDIQAMLVNLHASWGFVLTEKGLKQWPGDVAEEGDDL